MTKRAMAVAENLDRNLGTAVPQEAMDQRRRLAGLIRTRIAKPATATEKRLWQELNAEVEKKRMTFRS